jgi:hypothetical protein
MKRFAALPALLLLLAALPALCQTPAPAPAPVQSSMNFNIGANALGLSPTSSGVAATDVNLALNPGFKTLPGLAFRSDNLMAPGATNYFGGGINYDLPFKFPSTTALGPLTFYVDATVGGAVIQSPVSPATAARFRRETSTTLTAGSTHFGFMGGGGVKYLSSSGVQVTLIEVNLLHAPGPWGQNAPAISGGISYLFGH